MIPRSYIIVLFTAFASIALGLYFNYLETGNSPGDWWFLYSTGLPNIQNGILFRVLPEILGMAFGLLLFPGVVVGIIWLVVRFIARSKSDPPYAWIFLGLWVVISALNASTFHATKQFDTAQSTMRNDKVR